MQTTQHGFELLPPGSAVTFDNCAREAVHQPGAVRPHGAPLMARALPLGACDVTASDA